MNIERIIKVLENKMENERAIAKMATIREIEEWARRDALMCEFCLSLIKDEDFLKDMEDIYCRG